MKESLSRLEPRILVVGGGASGLALALACARRGVAVRIIEKRPARSHIQKATGVAQEAWHQLARFGVTQRIISTALPMRHFIFHDDERLVANVPVPLGRGQAPAHLYPQASLELAMEQALAAYGVRVEYGVAFASVTQAHESAAVTLAHAGGEAETVEVDWLVGADGSHSSVRSCIGMPCVGKDYPEDWSVADIATRQWPDDVQAQLFLRSDGVGLFLSQLSPASFRAFSTTLALRLQCRNVSPMQRCTTSGASGSRCDGCPHPAAAGYGSLAMPPMSRRPGTESGHLGRRHPGPGPAGRRSAR